jgi:hypothetical protein
MVPPRRRRKQYSTNRPEARATGRFMMYSAVTPAGVDDGDEELGCCMITQARRPKHTRCAASETEAGGAPRSKKIVD